MLPFIKLSLLFLFFSFPKKIECFFQSEVEFTTKEFLSVFTSAGLAPSLEIINSTYTGIFHFNLTLVITFYFILWYIINKNTVPFSMCF